MGGKFSESWHCSHMCLQLEAELHVCCNFVHLVCSCGTLYETHGLAVLESQLFPQLPKHPCSPYDYAIDLKKF